MIHHGYANGISAIGTFTKASPNRFYYGVTRANDSCRRSKELAKPPCSSSKDHSTFFFYYSYQKSMRAFVQQQSILACSMDRYSRKFDKRLSWRFNMDCVNGRFLESMNYNFTIISKLALRFRSYKKH